jgi:hypothetical protein
MWLLVLQTTKFSIDQIATSKKIHQILRKPPIGLPNNKNPNMATHKTFAKPMTQ